MVQALNAFFSDSLPRDGHTELAKQLTKQLATKVEELSVKKKAMTADPFSALQVNLPPLPSSLPPPSPSPPRKLGLPILGSREVVSSRSVYGLE